MNITLTDDETLKLTLLLKIVSYNTTIQRYQPYESILNKIKDASVCYSLYHKVKEILENAITKNYTEEKLSDIINRIDKETTVLTPIELLLIINNFTCKSINNNKIYQYTIYDKNSFPYINITCDKNGEHVVVSPAKGILNLPIDKPIKTFEDIQTLIDLFQ